MPAKIVKIYVCSKCDAQSSKWSGRCLECGAWGTLIEQTVDQKNLKTKELGVTAVKTIDFAHIKAAESERMATSLSELDRVLGGGIMPGSLILLGGEPGIGKSTLVAQIAGLIKNNSSVIYVSGEESAAQIKTRLNRLGADFQKIGFLNEINVEKIIATVEEVKPRLVIIDSIQTVYTSSLETEAGGLNQIRASTLKFLELAKQKNVSFVLTGHITKDGQLAGPKSLEHIVDTVIYLENEPIHNYKILRATKNRFGSINELGVFEMTGEGLKEIKNPGAIFIASQEEGLSGSIISCIMEGSRPFLVEVQALVTKTVFGYPVRKASGFDLNRLQVLIAVLIKRAKINLTNQDVILNVVGGLKINEPALDLAVCLAIVSSLLNQSISRKTIILGEVGLGGEIRNISKLDNRLSEAEKLGFNKAIIPYAATKNLKIKLEKISNLAEVVKKITSL